MSARQFRPQLPGAVAHIQDQIKLLHKLADIQASSGKAVAGLSPSRCMAYHKDADALTALAARLTAALEGM